MADLLQSMEAMQINDDLNVEQHGDEAIQPLRHKETCESLKSLFHDIKQENQLQQPQQQPKSCFLKGSSQTEITNNLKQMSSVAEKLKNAYTMLTPSSYNFYETVGNHSDVIVKCLNNICTVLNNETGLNNYEIPQMLGITMAIKYEFDAILPGCMLLSSKPLDEIKAYLYTNAQTIQRYKLKMEETFNLDLVQSMQAMEIN